MGTFYSGIKNELLTDPLGMGYSGFVAAGNDIANSALLNGFASGPSIISGVNGTGFVFRNDVGMQEVINTIASGDFIKMTQLQFVQLQTMFSPGKLDASNANYRVNFNAIFSGMAATQSGLLAISRHMGSRAEVLFGYGASVSPADVGQALRHT